MKVSSLSGAALNNKSRASENARHQRGDGYLDDIRLESFGHLLADYVLQGALLYQDLADKKALSIQEGIISFQDQLWRVYSSNFRTHHIGTTYYLGFLNGQGYMFGTSKPLKDYLPLWEVTTDGNGDILKVTDKRGELGKVKYKAIYDGVYLNTGEVQAAIDAAIKATSDVNNAVQGFETRADQAIEVFEITGAQTIDKAGQAVDEFVTKVDQTFDVIETRLETKVDQSLEGFELKADQSIVKFETKADQTIDGFEKSMDARVGEWAYDEFYNPLKTYNKNNVVSLSGNSYIAIQAVPVGNHPTGQPNDPYWRMYARAGADGTGTVVMHEDKFISTLNQKTFFLSHEYDQFQNRIEVTVGGARQSSQNNYSESSPTSITFHEGVPLGIKVVVRYFSKAQPIETDLETAVNQLSSQVSTILTDMTSDIDGGTFEDNTAGALVDGGDF